MTGEAVAAYLREHHYGADHAAHNGVIAQAMGFTDLGSAGRAGRLNSRQLTACLNEARALGHPLCCDHRGIFYTKARTEMVPMLKDYLNRAKVYGQQAEFLLTCMEEMEKEEAAA